MGPQGILPGMRRELLVAAISCCVTGLQAQPASGDPTFDRQAARERREDLRRAWESDRTAESPAAPRRNESAPPMRHLSQRELAEMREQLRRQARPQPVTVPAQSP